jgi:hypothetical protein
MQAELVSSNNQILTLQYKRLIALRLYEIHKFSVKIIYTEAQLGNSFHGMILATYY